MRRTFLILCLIALGALMTIQTEARKIKPSMCGWSGGKYYCCSGGGGIPVRCWPATPPPPATK